MPPPDARVERWPEDSGNAALAGRELPPAEVLAADQKITAWAKELKKAGLAGDMDQLRARAFLDILLDVDSRPGQAAGTAPDSSGSGPAAPGGPGTLVPAGSGTGVIPAGFTGRVMLTVPLATLLELADRPGEIPGIGPVHPELARDLVSAAARSPRTTWCVTVTDRDGHAIGHGCARDGPRLSAARRQKPGRPGGHDPPGGTGIREGPGFTFTASGEQGPPDGYGCWRLSTGVPGQRDLTIALGPLTNGECDHRHQAKGQDPGVMLRHLTQIRHATCTGPSCRRPAEQCEFEHNLPYEAGGRTCLCNGDPESLLDHVHGDAYPRSSRRAPEQVDALPAVGHAVPVVGV